MIERTYVWDVTIPEGKKPQAVLQKAQWAAERIAQYNRDVQYADAVLGPEGTLTVAIRFVGRDQWWIKKMIVYAIGGILAQTRIPRANATLTAIHRDDRRLTREFASDGSHKPIPDDQDIDHSDLGLVTP